MRRSFHPLFLCVLALFAVALSAIRGQTPPDKVDKIRLEVKDVGRAADGSLVLGVRVYAKSAHDMDLIGEREELGVNSPTELHPDYIPFKPFSMAGSFLVDTYTNKKIDSLNSIPDEPFFGSMSLVGRVKRGGWIKLGVAFPKIPPPPPDSKGNPQPYKLMLHTPLDAEPVLVTFPSKS